MDYKNTLNLPKTNFSMKANLTHLEPRILSFWEKIEIYERISQEHRNKEKFILHDGPPYANGLIHIGHALNKILKDIVLKYKILRGYYCPFVVGWDCHGLPVEHQLFKELNLTKHDVERIDFRKKAKEFALKFVELQKEDFKRLGVFSDWQKPYLTLEPAYEAKVIQLLESLVSQGYIYRGKKPVNWCSFCETALAEAEVEYLEKYSESIYVRFKVEDLASLPTGGNFYFVIWTTTPWTLVANVAIALHPEEFYCALSCRADEGWIVAEKLKDNFLDILKVDKEKIKVLWSVKGKELEGSTYFHPFGLRKGRVVLADYVSMEEGTGCVHTAPGHGQEDFFTAKKYNLEVVMPVDEKARFDTSFSQVQGLNVWRANGKIIESLRGQGDLLFEGKILHAYPHCWRCKNPIIFRATSQWFLNVEHKGLRQRLLEEIENVQWVPFVGKERMRGMLLERPDWCLSRQRLWGVPIPAMRCLNCGEVILDKEVLRRVVRIFEREGSDSWFIKSLEDFLPPGFCCPNCQAKRFVKEEEILDVWFESGASFHAVLKQDPSLGCPADMYLEGSDQHRGWFQVSLIPAVAQDNSPPFKTILTHGFVVDGQGRKMSKSLGNVISPQEIIQRYGAEILRLWAAYSDYTEDVKISEDILVQLVDIYRKVRNTIRFILGNLYDFKPEQDFSNLELCELDRYMLSRTEEFFIRAVSFYESFSFYKACQEIFNFCNLDLSSFYLDILKDRLYTFSPHSHQRRSAQYALFYILKVLLKVSAPILCFTAEEAYQAFENLENKKESIFLTLLEEERLNFYDEGLMQRWAKVLQLRQLVLKRLEEKREAGLIGSSLEAQVLLSFKGEDYLFYKALEETLREAFIVSAVEIKEAEFKIEVERAKGKKCQRCWNWKEEVGKDKDYPDLCRRCVKVIKNI